MSNLPSSDDCKACQARLDELLFCECCERHNVNKPADYEPWLEKACVQIQNHTQHLDCSCNCRAEAREICRNHPTLVAAKALLALSRGS